MKIILQDGRRYFLRFDRGEEVLESLRDFCAKENFRSGYFSAIGAVGRVILMHYDPDTKKYSEKTFDQKLEIVNLSGNLSWHEEGPYIHAHGVFSDEEMKCWGGHVKELTVAATCEMFLIHTDGELNREFSAEIGLNLLT
ncbi:MAG: DNA-binding protein [bacterium]|nr:DNA-binding protein [bacterium]